MRADAGAGVTRNPVLLQQTQARLILHLMSILVRSQQRLCQLNGDLTASDEVLRPLLQPLR